MRLSVHSIYLVAVAACGAPAQLPAPSTPAASGSPAAAPRRVAAVSVTDDDIVLGGEDAGATLVAFFDLEDPYQRGVPTLLRQLAERRGRDLRIVVKHKPLPFYRNARPAAEAAVAVERLVGDAGAFRFIEEVASAETGNKVPALFAERAKQLGVDMERYHALLAGSAAREKVDRDLALAKALGYGKQSSIWLVNGVYFLQYYSDEQARLDALIDVEVAETKLLRARGMNAADAYAERVEGNLGALWGADGKRHGVR